jgi:hypothetical protein
VSGTTDTEIVKVSLELADIMGRGIDGRNAGGGEVVLPEIGGVV